MLESWGDFMDSRKAAAAWASVTPIGPESAPIQAFEAGWAACEEARENLTSATEALSRTGMSSKDAAAAAALVVDNFSSEPKPYLSTEPSAAQVLAAAKAYVGDEMSEEEWSWLQTQPEVVQPYLDGMRAALIAASEVAGHDYGLVFPDEEDDGKVYEQEDERTARRYAEQYEAVLMRRRKGTCDWVVIS